MDTSSRATPRKALKGISLALFIVGAIVLVRFTPLSDWLTPSRLTSLVESAGIWAPIVYILGYAAGVCLFVPGTLLAVIGATVFGPFLGFAYVWIGAMIGSSLAFLIGRFLSCAIQRTHV